MSPSYKESQNGMRSNLLCLLVFLISSTFFLSDIGENSIRYSDEATHVRVIQEMLASHDYLRPTLDGQLYLNKPPLKMWLTIAAIKVFGESNFSFRVIDGLCSAGIVALTFMFACQIFGNRRAGLLASFILLGSFGFFYGGRFNTATQDAFVVFFNTVALWFAFLIFENIEKNKSSKIALLMFGFGLALAAGVLAKSVVGFVPLVIIAVPYLLHPRVLRKLFLDHKVAMLLGLVATLLPIILYFGHVLFHFENAWSTIFGYDIKARLFTEGFHNPEKWWFYLDRLFVQSEFSAAWLLALGLLFQAFKSVGQSSFNQAFLTSWAFIPLFVFSCLQSRAFHYIGPAFPAFALSITALMYAAFSVIKEKSWKHGRILRALCLILLVAASLELSFAGLKAFKRLISEKRKLPIENAVNELKSIPNVHMAVGEFDFKSYLEGDTYQRWRQQVYLDLLSRDRTIYADAEQLNEAKESSKLDSLFTSYQSGMEILSGKIGDLKPCAYAPLWKPENKRQSVKPEPELPQALFLMFSSCQHLNNKNYISSINQSLPLDAKKVKALFGVGSKQKVGDRSFWRMDSDDAVITIARDDILAQLPSKLSLVAAVTKVGGKFPEINLAISINGRSFGTVSVSGGKFRDYGIDVPAGIWRNSENIVVIHKEQVWGESKAIQPNAMISELKIELLGQH